ncbi:uncharacterized protein LOC125715727 isoform X2 [Brienomyrus brachyistius]|uniref:uncharacterized protein LOC125715727 isoform X2 n=1 Tax=Brienomyrus brachyistius TaxID=42636 RepID=UPI0020B23138|nr:uncharacterized protein LOC125715727 isoform X2 [Brienomyrus brachyistius]
MSESVVRKIQPFTIGTRLSVPTAPKCPELMAAFLPSQVLDTCKAGTSTNQVSSGTDCPQVHVAQVAEAESVQEEVPLDDGLSSGALPQSSASRAIKKIHISGSTKPTGDVDVQSKHCRTAETSGSEDSYEGVCSLLPKITEASCENRSDSPLKGLLRKNADSEPGKSQSSPASGLRCLGDRITSTDQGLLLRSQSPTRELQNRNDPVCSNTGVGVMQNDCSITQRNTFFNREVLQAEQWIDGKLQDLKDGYNTCWASLQDWEEASQTLQRDLKDFENTLIQLNQMGEQLVCEQNPNADLVKKQLGQLRDHWHALKQVATKQAEPFAGAGNLHQANRKVNKVEVWIKEKQEEQQNLAETCRENTDKIQLTRRILDLEQDEKNDLAPKLEKYWRTESKNITGSRRDVSEMFFEIQSRLKDYHESLQLALEVSSFYQLADSIINAITNKSKSISVTNDHGSSGDKEIRDIASQITMLDLFVSRLSSFHPTLAARLTHKQGEVKGSWTLLQSLLSRKEVSDSPSNTPALTREDAGPLSMSSEPQAGVENEALRILGKEDKEEQNRLKGHVSVTDLGGAWKPADDQGAGRFSESSATSTGNSNSNMDDVMGRSQREPEREKQMTSPKLFLPEGTTSTDKEGQRQRQEQHPESTRIEGFFVQLELLWEELQKNREGLVEYQDLEKLDQKVIEALKDLNDLGCCLQSADTASVPRDPVSGAKQQKPVLEGKMPSCGSEMNQPPSEGHLYTQQLWTRLLTEDEKYQSTLRTLKQENLDPEHSDWQMALEESRGFLENGQGKVEQTLLVWINHSVSQSTILSMDILDAERDMSIDREPDCARLEVLQEQQDKLETDYESIREELVKMGVLAERSEVTCPRSDQVLGEEVRATLEAWEELDSSMAENRGRLRQLRQLQDFFCKYQAMILWPEFTQGCVFSGTVASSGDGGSELHREQKSRQFQDLAAAGQKLIDEGHHLTEMIQERTWELRTMLDWVRGHWSHRKQNSEPGGKATSEKKPIQSEPHPASETSISSHPPGGCHVLLGADSCDEGLNKPCSEPESKSAPTNQESPNTSPLQRETPKSPVFVLTEPTAPSLGGTVNLVLSFGESGGGQLQVHDVPEEAAASEPKHRVSAYLHVKEKQASDLLLVTGPPTHIVSKAQVSICPPATTCSQEVSITPFQDTTRCVSSSTFSTLKSKSEKRKKRSHRHTMRSMMGVDPEDLDLVHSCPIYSSHTWPLDTRKKKIPKARLANTDCLPYLKNPVAKDIVTKHKGDCFASNGKIPSECDKNQYKYLPLGSTLTFDLPKDLGHIPSIPAVITIDLPETNGKNVFSSNVGQNLNTDRHEGLSTFEMTHSPSELKREESKSDKITEQKQMPCKKDSCEGPESQNCDLNLASCLPPCEPLPEQEHTTEDHLCCTSQSDTSDKLSRLSGFNSPFEEVKHNKHRSLPLGLSSTKLNNNSHSPHVQNQDNQCNNKAHEHTSNLFKVKHVCPSVHTKIRDLNGHIYHSPAMWLRGQVSCSAASLTASSPASMSLKTSTTKKEDSADFGQHVKFTAGKVVGGPVPKATGEVVGSLEKEVTTVRKKDNCNSSESGNGVVLGAIHPDHGQFEEEEAELKDIWNRINGYKTCQGVHEKLAPAPTTQSRKLTPPDQDKLSRKPVNVSTHNLLVAEFKLPASIQNRLGYNKEQNPGQENLMQREKASWQSPPLNQQQGQHTILTNQTALSLGTSPSTDCRSTSWKSEEAIGENKINNISYSSMNEEVHSMDGVLEMMHHSETAGKATWTTFHTLLLKESLYFYRHKKDIPESSAPELTLDLTDAECSTCPECTGRSNSFCLRLGNGSRHHLSASSPFLMMKWMLKIQAISAEGRKKTQNSLSSFAKDLSLSMEATPSSQTTCHCIPGTDGISSSTKHNGTCSASAAELGVMASEKPLNPQGDCGDMRTTASRPDPGSTDQCHSLTGDSNPGPAHSYLSSSQGCPARSCPSHCFTSATYQKITPVAPPCGPSVGSSSYSVTLLIGEQPPEAAGPGAQSLCPAGQRQEPSLDARLARSSASLPEQQECHQ